MLTIGDCSLAFAPVRQAWKVNRMRRIALHQFSLSTSPRPVMGPNRRLACFNFRLFSFDLGLPYSFFGYQDPKP